MDPLQMYYTTNLHILKLALWHKSKCERSIGEYQSCLVADANHNHKNDIYTDTPSQHYLMPSCERKPKLTE